jgi:hypothetical protein
MLNLTLRDAKLSSTKCQISISLMLMSYIALVESKKDYSDVPKAVDNLIANNEK